MSVWAPYYCTILWRGVMVQEITCSVSTISFHKSSHATPLMECDAIGEYLYKTFHHHVSDRINKWYQNSVTDIDWHLVVDLQYMDAYGTELAWWFPSYSFHLTSETPAKGLTWNIQKSSLLSLTHYLLLQPRQSHSAGLFISVWSVRGRDTLLLFTFNEIIHGLDLYWPLSQQPLWAATQPGSLLS